MVWWSSSEDVCSRSSVGFEKVHPHSYSNLCPSKVPAARMLQVPIETMSKIFEKMGKELP